MQGAWKVIGKIPSEDDMLTWRTFTGNQARGVKTDFGSIFYNCKQAEEA